MCLSTFILAECCPFTSEKSKVEFLHFMNMSVHPGQGSSVKVNTLFILKSKFPFFLHLTRKRQNMHLTVKLDAAEMLTGFTTYEQVKVGK